MGLDWIWGGVYHRMIDYDMIRYLFFFRFFLSFFFFCFQSPWAVYCLLSFVR